MQLWNKYKQPCGRDLLQEPSGATEISEKSEAAKCKTAGGCGEFVFHLKAFRLKFSRKKKTALCTKRFCVFSILLASFALILQWVSTKVASAKGTWDSVHEQKGYLSSVSLLLGHTETSSGASGVPKNHPAGSECLLDKEKSLPCGLHNNTLLLGHIQLVLSRIYRNHNKHNEINSQQKQNIYERW